MKRLISSSSVVVTATVIVATSLLVFSQLDNSFVLGFVVPSSSSFQELKLTTLINDNNNNNNRHRIRTTPTTKTRLSYASPTSVFETSDDPFVILNLKPSPFKKDKEAIRVAYKIMAKKYHPDVVTNASSSSEEKKLANDMFAKINWAYETLISELKNGKGLTSNRSTSTSFGKVSVYDPSAGRSHSWSSATQTGGTRYTETTYYDNSYRTSSPYGGSTYGSKSRKAFRKEWSPPGYDDKAEVNADFEAKRRRAENEAYEASFWEEHQKQTAKWRKSQQDARSAFDVRQQAAAKRRRTQAADEPWSPIYDNKAEVNVEFEQERQRRRANNAERMAEDARIAEQDRLAAEEEFRRAQEKAHFEAEQQAAKYRAEDEARRHAAEQAAARIRREEQKQFAASQEAARLEKEAAMFFATDEHARIAVEELRNEEARIAEEAKAARLKYEEEARATAERASQLRAQEEARMAAELEAVRKRTEEDARIAAQERERLKREEEARIDAEQEAARLRFEQEARLAAEEDALLQAEEEARIAAEEEAVRLRTEEDARIAREAREEADRLKAEEEARMAAEAEAIRLKTEEDARIAAEQAAISISEEEARIAAAEAEAERVRAAEDARIAAEKEEEDARLKAAAQAEEAAATQKHSTSGGGLGIGGVFKNIADVIGNGIDGHSSRKRAKDYYSGKTMRTPHSPVSATGLKDYTHSYEGNEQYQHTINNYDSGKTSHVDSSSNPSVGLEDYTPTSNYETNDQYQHTNLHYSETTSQTSYSEQVNNRNGMTLNQRLKEKELSMLQTSLDNAKSYIEKNEIQQKIDELQGVNTFKSMFSEDWN